MAMSEVQWLPLRHTASLYDLNFDATLRCVNRELTTRQNEVYTSNK